MPPKNGRYRLSGQQRQPLCGSLVVGGLMSLNALRHGPQVHSVRACSGFILVIPLKGFNACFKSALHLASPLRQ